VTVVVTVVVLLSVVILRVVVVPEPLVTVAVPDCEELLRVWVEVRVPLDSEIRVKVAVELVTVVLVMV
jgi:hypothetical protein